MESLLLEPDRATHGKTASRPEISLAFPRCCSTIVSHFNSDYACVSCARNKLLIPSASNIKRRVRPRKAAKERLNSMLANPLCTALELAQAIENFNRKFPTFS